MHRDHVIASIRQIVPRLPIVVFGERDSAKAAMDALQQGAAYYLAKPLTVEAIRTACRHIQVAQGSKTQKVDDASDGFDPIIGVSPQIQLLKRLAKEVAATDATVLITGESGTGKELFARAIHQTSPRAKGPFLALNCAGIPEHLLESELFGYHQGAFTDAKHNKPGRFELAEGGTLFLDEIGEMSSAAQAKLLRVLEDHKVDPLGDTKSHLVNIRVIAATNEDLPAQIKAGRFRLDLYYRLNVYQLRIPPLRERLEDIEPILRSFLETTRLHNGHRIRDIAPAALSLLRRHSWPGNVRELHNVVEGLTITCKEEIIRPEHHPPALQSSAVSSPNAVVEKVSLLAFGLSFQEMEKRMLEEALRTASGNVSEASRLLKMTRNTLRYRMAKHHIS
jgi:DNA-binding NtrC family response regulator